MPLSLFEYDHPDDGIFAHTPVILKELSNEEWSKLLSCMERRKYPAHATLLKAFERDRSLHIIASGSVAVSVTVRGTERDVGIIGEGSVFGEMAFLDGQPRSATIRSLEPVEVLSLPYDSFESLMSWEPRLVGRVLSQRLRQNQAGM
jgi:CRP-like cAMP-binding protein